MTVVANYQPQATSSEACAVCKRPEERHVGLIHPFTPGKAPDVCADCGGGGGKHKATCAKAVLCADCGGGGGNHKATCAKAVLCADCGGGGGKHKATCAKAVLCADCGSGGNHKATCAKAVTKRPISVRIPADVVNVLKRTARDEGVSFEEVFDRIMQSATATQ